MASENGNRETAHETAFYLHPTFFSINVVVARADGAKFSLETTIHSLHERFLDPFRPRRAHTDALTPLLYYFISPTFKI